MFFLDCLLNYLTFCSRTVQVMHYHESEHLAKRLLCYYMGGRGTGGGGGILPSKVANLLVIFFQIAETLRSEQTVAESGRRMSMVMGRRGRRPVLQLDDVSSSHQPSEFPSNLISLHITSHCSWMVFPVHITKYFSE